jgi:hypothetical protein
MKLRYCVLAVCLLAGLCDRASANPVILKGFVADLGGVPHTAPEITVEVRTFPGGAFVTSKPVETIDGSFTIEIPADRIPNEDTRISVRASGFAVLNGRRTAVRTDSDLIGLSGEILAKFSNEIGGGKVPITQFIILVVPKAKEPTCYYCPRGRLFRRCR